MTGERRLATENLAEYAAKSGVLDAPDNLLADGDAVVPIKDLKDMAAGQPLKQAAVMRSIRLIDNLEEVDAGMM